jgi:flagellar basal-body rod modification protein FlgD
MQIDGINSTDPISLSGGKDAALGKDAFMSLLVMQMKNQDPMEPTKNDQMLAQLAQFQSLEEMDELNNNIVGLAVLQQSNAVLQQLTSSSALIGQDVRYTNEAGDEQWGKVEAVRIEDGVAQLQIGGKSVPLGSVLEIGLPPTAETEVPPASDTQA